MTRKLRRFYWRITTCIYGAEWRPKGFAIEPHVRAGETVTERDLEFMLWKIQTGQWSTK